MNDTTLAVIITNYNYARFLPHALDSVLTQKPPFDEIIVVDDGSTDGSLDVLAGYSDRISVISIANGGQLGAVRRGVMAATSEYIYTLDADDIAAPGLVAKVKETLADRRPVKIQFQLRAVREDGSCLGSAFPAFTAGYDTTAMLRDNETAGFYVSPPTSGQVFKREALISLGFDSFDSSKPFDGSSSLAMPYLGEVISISEPLAHYRVHGASLSGWPNPTIPLLSKEIRIFRESWDEVVAALGLEKPPFKHKPLYIVERNMMIACKQRKLFVLPEVWLYITGIPSTHLPGKQKLLLIAWALCLLIPSAAVRDHCIRVRRSSANRSKRLQALVNMIKRQPANPSIPEQSPRNTRLNALSLR